MAEHELNKIVDDDGEVFNLRDSTKQPVSDRVTSWGSTPSDTKYPSEKLVKDSLDAKAPNAVTTEAAIATGDKLLFSDDSDNSKTKRNSAGFDTSKTNQVLKASGTFGSVLYADEDWGGKFRNTLSPFDNYAFKSANCFFGAKPSAIRVEYSTDGGTTWTDYGLTSEQKQAIFNQYAGLTVYCGKNTHIQPGYTGSTVGTKDLSNDNIADQRLRITICESSLANEGGTGSTDRWLYCNLRRIGIYCTTNSSGQGGLHCVFEKRTRGNFKSATDSWVTVGDFNIQGDSGWNSLPCDNGYAANGSIRLGSYSDSYYSEVRFTVWANKLNASPAASQTGNPGINKIVAYSELLWTNVSSNANMANFGAPYTVNASTGVAHFSKGITSGVAIPISSGGTGATTKKAAEYAINGGMAQATGEPQDSFQFVFSRVGSDQSATNGVFIYRTAATIWSWIKGKISSVLGLSESNGVKTFTGNAATASAAQSGSALETAINGKMNTSASNATAPSGSGGDGATATLLNNLTEGISDIVTTDDGDNVLIATTDNGGSVTNKWYKRKLVKLIPWIIKKLGTGLVYDCGAGSTSGDDFDNALAAFNAGQWVIIRKDGIVYYCVGSYSGPGLRFKQIANDASLLKVNTITWTRGSSPSDVTQMEASLSGHTHSQYLTASSITGKMNTDAGNAASGALQNLTAQLTEGTSNFTDNTEIFTSYAGNSGFAESGHVNQPYRRKASSMLNYVRTMYAEDRSPANVGTSHKRISLGYGKYNSSAVGAATYLVHLFFNYADDGGLQGKGITVLVTYDFRKSSLQKAECRILSDNGVRDSGYNIVLANYVSGSGDNSKLYICIGLVKNSAPTTLVAFAYSYCKIFKLCTIGDWTQDISSDAVGTYDYIIQATDLVSAAVNADMVDGKHIVIGSWAGASNTIYFG